MWIPSYQPENNVKQTPENPHSQSCTSRPTPLAQKNLWCEIPKYGWTSMRAQRGWDCVWLHNAASRTQGDLTTEKELMVMARHKDSHKQHPKVGLTNGTKQQGDSVSQAAWETGQPPRKSRGNLNLSQHHAQVTQWTSLNTNYKLSREWPWGEVHCRRLI